MEDNTKAVILSSSACITPLCLLREAVEEAEMYLTKAQALVDKGSRCSTKKFARMSRWADEVLNKIHVGKDLLRRYKLQCCAHARPRGKARKAARQTKAKRAAAVPAGKNQVWNMITETDRGCGSHVVAR